MQEAEPADGEARVGAGVGSKVRRQTAGLELLLLGKAGHGTHLGCSEKAPKQRAYPARLMHEANSLSALISRFALGARKLSEVLPPLCTALRGTLCSGLTTQLHRFLPSFLQPLGSTLVC